MRKILFAVLVLSILVLSGCKAPEEAGTTQTAETKAPAVREVRQGQEQVTRGPALSPELKQLLAKAKTVESLEYYYRESEKGGQYYVMDKNMKIVFPMKRQYGNEDKHYDSVYIDLDKQTAVGYCQEDNDCDPSEYDEPRELDINDYYLETPLDVVKEIEYGEKISEETIDGKKAIIIKYTLSDGNEKRVWVWDYKGVPLRYVIEDSEGELIRKVDFDDLSANGVRASDVIK